MRILGSVAFIIAAASLASCSGGDPLQFGEPRPMYLPAGSNTMGSRLTVGSNGTAVLSWMQRTEKGATLRYSTLGDGEWHDAIDVVSDPDMFVNWADLPSVTPLDQQHWVAHWLSKSAAETYAYDVLFTQSSDGGQSWSDPVKPHTDGTPTEHGFVSLYGYGDSTALLWLDGRKTGADASDDPTTTGMTLRSAAVARDGGLSGEQLVDDLVCDCCQTDIAVSSDGPIAVYRNRTVEEIRDIYVTRFSDGQWEAGSPIADDGWKIAGCPVNGPAIDAMGDLVAIAWFSAANDKTIVRAAVSTNAGRTFKKPVEIASSRASGHVGIAVIDRTSVAVSWVESDKRGTNAIRIRSLTSGGVLGPAETVGRSTLLRIYPQLARSEDRLILAWTDEITDTSEIVSIEVPILGYYDL
ncbi:MAG: hypothetical protein ACR2QZ_09080 [Woeseiaceae bacterium]